MSERRANRLIAFLTVAIVLVAAYVYAQHATSLGRSGTFLKGPTTDAAGVMKSDGSGSLSLAKVLTTDASSVSGSDTTFVTGTAGTASDLVIWNGDGDVVDGPTPPSGAIVGTTDTQTLTDKTFDLTDNTLTGTKAEFNSALSDGSFTYSGFEPVTSLNNAVANRLTTVAATVTELDGEMSLTYDGNLLTQYTDSSLAARNFRIQQHNDLTGGPKIDFYKSSNTQASPTIVANGAALGQVSAYGYDGSSYIEVGQLRWIESGTEAATRIGTEFSIWTATDAAPSVLTERLTIANDGDLTLTGAVTGITSFDLSNNTVTGTKAEFDTAVSDDNLVGESRTITVAGTSSEIDSSAGAQDLSANRTWTIGISDNPVLPGTGSFKVPTGTTAQEPVGSNGEMRYDTTTNMFRVYEGGAWMDLGAGGGGITDGDTLSTGLTFPNTGLRVLDTNASHDLVITPGSDLTADRTLNITTGDSGRTVTINGDTTLSGTNTGDQTITLTGDVTGSGTGSFATSLDVTKAELNTGVTDATIVDVSATPANTQLATWTDSDTITGQTNATWSGGNLTLLDPVNDGNPNVIFGASGTERTRFQAVFDSGTQNLHYAQWLTETATATADHGHQRFLVDGTEQARFDDDGIELRGGGVVKMLEVAAAPADESSYGQLWVRSSDSMLIFTDDGGTDTALGSGGGDVTKSGTSADGQIAVWTGDGPIEGTNNFKWDDATGAFEMLTSAVSGFIELYSSNAAGNPEFRLGGSDTERFRIVPTMAGSAVTAVTIATQTAGGGAHNGEIIVEVDDTEKLRIDDDGIDVTGEMAADRMTLNVTEKTNDFTVAVTDNGFIEVNKATLVTVTLPNGLDTGVMFSFTQEGAGEVTFTATGTLRSRGTGYDTIDGQYGVAHAVHVGGNVWYLYGDIKP